MLKIFLEIILAVLSECLYGKSLGNARYRHRSLREATRWQMDFWRHIDSGRLSETFGSSQVETDRYLRTMGWARVAQQEIQEINAEIAIFFPIL